MRELLGIEFDGRGVFSNSDHDLFPRAISRRCCWQAAQRDLHRQSGARRILPHGQEQNPASCREHGRRHAKPEASSAAADIREEAADRVRARRRRRARTAGQDRRRRALARDLRRRAPVSGRPRVPRRRCRASDAAQRRLRRQHRHSRRAQSRLEARAGAARESPDRSCSTTYEIERRPVGKFTVEQAYTRYVTRTAPYLGAKDFQPPANDFNIELGYLNNSAAILADNGDALSETGHEHPHGSLGRPGSRAPHLWLKRGNRDISTIDLFDGSFVLLAAPEGAAWLDAAGAVREQSTGLELNAHLVGGLGRS